MIEALRYFGMVFYAPSRVIRLAVDRGRLARPVLFVLSVQTIFAILFYGPYFVAAWVQATKLIPAWMVVVQNTPARWAMITLASFFVSTFSLALIGLVFVPAVIYVAARMARRVPMATLLQRDYARAAAAVFCAYGVATIWGIVIAAILRATGIVAFLVQASVAALEQARAQDQKFAAMIQPEIQREILAAGWFQFAILPGILLALWMAVRIVFGLNRGRAALVTIAGILALWSVNFLLSSSIGSIIAAPILMVMSFFVLRASFLSALDRQRDVAALEQAVTEADRSPHDPRAQYDLGMLLLKRGETQPAAERFERALERDPEDHDTRFQLGRIARQEGRWADAIKHFEFVVADDFAHAHYEIWREVGATYLGARQYNDAVAALERFLDHRPEDAEGWCLLGQAQAGSGNQIEATAAMHACVTAVDGLAEPDTEAREWRANAEKFLRSIGR